MLTVIITFLAVFIITSFIAYRILEANEVEEKLPCFRPGKMIRPSKPIEKVEEETKYHVWYSNFTNRLYVVYYGPNILPESENVVYLGEL